MSCASQKQRAATIAAAGIVRIQAITIFIAIFHLIPIKFVTAPTPMIDPAIVCVVEMGIPKLVARNMVRAPDVSAAKP